MLSTLVNRRLTVEGIDSVSPQQPTFIFMAHFYHHPIRARYDAFIDLLARCYRSHRDSECSAEPLPDIRGLFTQK